MTRAIIFDCFGVLYVTVNQLYSSQFPKLRDELRDLDRQSDHGLIDRPAYVAAVAQLTGISEQKTLEAFLHEYTLNHPVIDYIQTTLKPAYKIGLLSNVGQGWMQEFFNDYQLHDLFDVAVISGQEGVAKPEPAIYQRAAERLGLPPEECLFIDDRQINCDGAVNAGMQAMLFTDLATLKQQLNQLL